MKIKDIISKLFNLQQNKVDKVEGYGLSKNDYTNAAKTAVANIETDIAASLSQAKAYTDAEITDLKNSRVVVVTDVTEVEEPQVGVIYLELNGSEDSDNLYNEYLFVEVDGVLVPELYGTAKIDLSDFVTKGELEGQANVWTAENNFTGGLKLSGANVLTNVTVGSVTVGEEPSMTATKSGNGVVLDIVVPKGSDFLTKNVFSTSIVPADLADGEDGSFSVVIPHGLKSTHVAIRAFNASKEEYLCEHVVLDANTIEFVTYANSEAITLEVIALHEM